MDDKQPPLVMLATHLPCGCTSEFRCSRCGRCYYHQHKAVYLVQADKWMWKTLGKFEPVILEP